MVAASRAPTVAATNATEGQHDNGTATTTHENGRAQQAHGDADEFVVAFLTAAQLRRLDEEVGDDAPGLLSRSRGAKTLVAYSSRFLADLGEDALDSIHADREEVTDDRSERADDRVADHLQNLGLTSSDAQQLTDAVSETRV